MKALANRNEANEGFPAPINMSARDGGNANANAASSRLKVGGHGQYRVNYLANHNSSNENLPINMYAGDDGGNAVSAKI